MCDLNAVCLFYLEIIIIVGQINQILNEECIATVKTSIDMIKSYAKVMNQLNYFYPLYVFLCFDPV